MIDTDTLLEILYNDPGATNIEILNEKVIVSDMIFLFDKMDITAPNAAVDKNNKIWANTAFLREPFDMQESIIAHEIGHKRLGHISSSKRTLKGELQADLYAACLVGKDIILKMLNRTFDDAVIIFDTFSTVEFAMRIKILGETECPISRDFTDDQMIIDKVHMEYPDE